MLMTNSKKIIKPVCLLIPSLIMSPLAFALDFNVVSGTFFMGGVTSAPIALTPGNDTGVLTEGLFQGTPNSSANQALFAPFTFFGKPVGTYTAATGVDGVTHPAPSVDLNTGSADMSSFYAYWNGIEFNQGSANATVEDNFDNTYTISWNQLINGGPFDGFTGFWAMRATCPSCPPSAPGLAVNLEATQGSESTRTVTKDGGLVTVQTNLTSSTGYTFTWGPTSDALEAVATTATTDPNFIFNPATVAEGTYIVRVGVTDNNVSPLQKSITTLVIRVIATGNLSTTLGDADNDGIANSVDTINAATQLQGEAGNNTSNLLTSSAGSLAQGDIAACANTNSAEVTLNQIKNNAELYCFPTTKSVDPTFAVSTGIGGYFDFQVRNLSQNAQVHVVIPVHAALPKNAGFRKFNNKQTPAWNPFDTTGADSVASAPATSSGVCPAPDATSWQSGLEQGHDCVRLSITDGGVNDGDGFLNGVVTMTGAIEGYPGIGTDLQDDGCSMTGHTVSARNHLEWLLVVSFVIGLGLFRKQQKQ